MQILEGFIWIPRWLSSYLTPPKHLSKNSTNKLYFKCVIFKKAQKGQEEKQEKKKKTKTKRNHEFSEIWGRTVFIFNEARAAEGQMQISAFWGQWQHPREQHGGETGEGQAGC